VPKNALDDYPVMTEYLTVFKSLPQIVAYEASKS
jgi:hypothetical protein